MLHKSRNIHDVQNGLLAALGLGEHRDLTRVELVLEVGEVPRLQTTRAVLDLPSGMVEHHITWREVSSIKPVEAAPPPFDLDAACHDALQRVKMRIGCAAGAAMVDVAYSFAMLRSEQEAAFARLSHEVSYRFSPLFPAVEGFRKFAAEMGHMVRTSGWGVE